MIGTRILKIDSEIVEKLWSKLAPVRGTEAEK